jgi:hypothetical protein
MATHRIPLATILVPDTSGNAFWQPAAILDANDLFGQVPVLVFLDSGTKISAFAVIPVPKNYVGSPKVGIRWKANATTGDVVWDVDYRAIANNEPGDPTTFQESLTATDTADATARDLNDAEVSLTAANLAVDDSLFIAIARDGASGSDTLAASAELIDAWFEYTDA